MIPGETLTLVTLLVELRSHLRLKALLLHQNVSPLLLGAAARDAVPKAIGRTDADVRRPLIVGPRISKTLVHLMHPADRGHASAAHVHVATGGVQRLLLLLRHLRSHHRTCDENKGQTNTLANIAIFREISVKEYNCIKEF